VRPSELDQRRSIREQSYELVRERVWFPGLGIARVRNDESFVAKRTAEMKAKLRLLRMLGT
jgi:hypothetical protein